MSTEQPVNVLEFLGVNNMESFYFAMVDMPFRVNLGKECLEAELFGEWSPVKNAEVIQQIFFHPERIHRPKRSYTEAEKSLVRYICEMYSVTSSAVLERNVLGALQLLDGTKDLVVDIPCNCLPQIARGEQVSITDIISVQGH